MSLAPFRVKRGTNGYANRRTDRYTYAELTECSSERHSDSSTNRNPDREMAAVALVSAFARAAKITHAVTPPV